MIEAVFEDPSLKAEVFAEVLPFVNDDALLCSNTSTLPISELATGVDRPADFIGLHFFSPVDKMPLVEIIRGAATSGRRLASAYDVVQQIRKTPIVVNDSRGFYTSRVIGTMVNEGLAMLAEGVHPVSLERAATQGGLPRRDAPALRRAQHGADGQDPRGLPRCCRARGDLRRRAPRRRRRHPDDRAGSSVAVEGCGLLRLDESGRRTRIWPGLAAEFAPSATQIPLQDIKDRLLFVEALETAACFEEGVIASAAAANIGSIMGIGFPANTGGAAQFMLGYERDDQVGLVAFIARADELAAAYGDRFRPGAYLRGLAERGETFPA